MKSTHWKPLGAVLLALIIGATMLPGCGGGDDDNEKDSSAALRGKEEKDD